jgi:RHS repeat-associated protein
LWHTGAYRHSGKRYPPYAAGLNGTTSSTGNGPKAYMNWLIFDRNFVFKNGGYVRMTSAAREYGQDVNHEKLTAEFKISEPGFVYVYLSNEEATPIDVYFDDWKVTQVNSPLLEVNEYYPFGALMSTSYTRENGWPNRYKYNGKELIAELNLSWMDYGVRQRGDFDPRWKQIDPMAEKFHSSSPYLYAFGSPIVAIDPDGQEGTIYIQVLTDKKGKSAVDRKLVDAAVKGLNQLFKNKGIDLKVEAHYGNKIMSKKEFYERKGADKTDSYTIIGAGSNLKSVAKEAKEKGWEEVKGNSDGFKSLQGESAKNDFFSLINSDVITDAKGKVINKDIVDQVTKIWETEDYLNPVEKIMNLVQHETGHPKFRDHYRIEGKHVPYTIMQILPKRQSTYDSWMLNRLLQIHGSTSGKPNCEQP